MPRPEGVSHDPDVWGMNPDLPSLDEIARDPDRLAALPDSVILDLYPQAVRLEAELRARVILGRGVERRADTAPADELLDIAEAARRLGMSRSWLYRNARRLPFTVRMGHVLRFDPRGLDKHVAARAGAVR
jgi:predicted DNA-binding transcriptional regulator AlpA